jgi:AAHS family 4-hydroxybenzoate transporter-like MFS transporter
MTTHDSNMTTHDSNMVNVTKIIDDSQIRGFQILVFVLCSLAAFLDGIDTQNIGVAAPIIAANMKLSHAALGPVFSSALVGATLGALTFGPLGDQYGRKVMLALAAFMFGIFTIATAYAEIYEQLLAIRFAAGIGMGGATPCFIALASEFAPARRRAMVASAVWSAFPLGGFVGGFLNAYILSTFGWQSIFLFGGVLPLLITLAFMIWLPESLKFLIAKGGETTRITAIVQRLQPNLPANAQFVSNEQKVQGIPLKRLFSEGRALWTLLLWVPFFAAFGVLILAVLWTPTLLHDNGIPLTQAARAIAFNGLGALIGMGTAGRLIERFGAGPVLVPAFLLGAVTTALLGYAAASAVGMAVGVFLIGLFIGMGGSGAIALAALTYPTAIRSSGVGWAMGVGRFAQVLAPLFAGFATAAGWSSVQLFVVLAIAPVLAALAIIALRAVPAQSVALETVAAPGAVAS